MDLIEIEKMIAEATVKLEAENARLLALCGEDKRAMDKYNQLLMLENGAIRSENARLREELAASERTREGLVKFYAGAVADAARYRWLREECGYVQDGSSTSVTICQDDATHDWIVRSGPVGSKHWWHGRSLGEAIDNAMKEQS